MELDAVIVGASWAGIWTCNLLKRLDLKVLLIDACEDVGGTWCYTRYPGCHVDTELPLYEFSDPNLWKNWTWTKRFPDRKQIQQYLSWATDHFGMRENLLLNAKVQAAKWDERSQTWSVSVSGGATYRTQYFILCAGYSTIPYLPKFHGAEKFKNCFHASAWPEDLDWKSKRVGVIGTAASGLQIIEALAPNVSQLTVFQRTPNLATPMRQIEYTPKQMDQLKKSFYPNMFKQRNSSTGFFAVQSRSGLQETPEQRQRMFQTLWNRGGLSFWFGNYADLLTCHKVNMEAYRFWRERVHARVHDKATAEKLAPTKPPHAFGTKRPSLETSYFEAYNLLHVELVDVNDDSIQEITSSGVRTRSKFYELDILIYATGFDALTGSGLAIDIRGIGGVKLESKWDTRANGNGVSTALGMMSSGFPNMFFPMGPQAPSALGLTPHLAEIQGGWVADCIQHMRTRGLARIEPTIESEQAWRKEVNRAAEATLFGEADSWYMGVNIPGRKKQPLCYFGGVGKYAEHLQQTASAGYKGFNMSPTAGHSRL
ncbi:hypothetical protein BJX64DRAFT_296034 [Aspergillus heterothallicus]